MLAALGLGADTCSRATRARGHLDHRLRPERRLPRLGRQRLDPHGDERDPQPLGPGRARAAAMPPGLAYETAAIQAAWAALVAYWNRLETGRGDHVDFSIFEAAAQIMDPAYGTASVSRASALPLDARASGGRPVPDLPVCGRLRARLRACAAPVAGDARLARRARGVRGRAYDAISARFGAAAGCTRCTPRCSPARRRTRSRREGQARGVPIAPVLDVSEVLAAPHFLARGAFIDAEVAPGRARPAADRVRRVRRRPRRLPPSRPEPGEHDDELDRRRGSGRRGPRRRAPPRRAGRWTGCASSTSASSSSAPRSAGCSPTRART